MSMCSGPLTGVLVAILPGRIGLAYGVLHVGGIDGVSWGTASLGKIHDGESYG